MWQRTDQAPVNEFVVGYWSDRPDYVVYQEVRYSHDLGWVDRRKDQVAVPHGWAPLPPSRTSE